MRSVINSMDSYGNTPLHYAKHYPDTALVIFLLQQGAKINLNSQGIINVVPKTLEEYFYDHCIKSEGGDIDDEDFSITVNFRLFEKPIYDGKGKNPFKEKSNKKTSKDAWTTSVESDHHKSESSSSGKSSKLDTKRLELFSAVDSFVVNSL